MNILNFVTTVSPQQHKALKRWYLLSITALALLVLGITIMQSMQLYELAQAKRTLAQAQARHQGIAPLLTNHQTLVAQEKELQEKLTQLNTMAQPRKIWAGIVQALGKATSAHDAITSCTLTPTNITITVTCQTAAAASKMVNKLAKTAGITSLKLVSLQPTNMPTQPTNMPTQPGFSATIEGVIGTPAI